MRLSIILLCFAAAIYGEPVGISGVVQEVRTTNALAGVTIQVQSESTGARWRTESSDDGHYSFAGLPVGQYKVTARLAGFRTVSRLGVALSPGAGTEIDFVMELLELHEVITVVSGRDDLDPAVGDSLMVTRGTPGATLPANGRDIRSSFDLMPGIVITPASVSDAGQFSSNGQRPNASTFRLDGVSANTGVGGNGLPGSLPGASLPAMNAVGTMENLASHETTQSVELRTSTFAPESGERPGASTFISTRSGTNSYHGEFFTQLRDKAWTARDWFANSRGLAYTRPTYRRWGGVFGGPIIANRTFVFVSAEESRLNFDGIALSAVPSLDARLHSELALRPLLTMFPSPSGRDLGGGMAEGLAGVGRRARLSSYSARIDQSLGSIGTLFGRFVEAPSSADSAFDYTHTDLGWRSLTVGLTAGQPGKAIHDVRFNYSRSSLAVDFFDKWRFAFEVAEMTSFEPPLEMFQKVDDIVFGLSVPSLGQFVGGSTTSPRQDQWELRYAYAKDLKRHQWRVGIDGLRINASRDAAGGSLMGAAPSLETFLNHGPLAFTYSTIPQTANRVDMVSLYAQDTYRINERLSVMYGIRWELTPPTATLLKLPTLAGLRSQSQWEQAYFGDINGAAPWTMSFRQFAPRLGIAYRLPGSSFVLRASGGVFYDTKLGAAINPINGAPFNSWRSSAGVTVEGDASLPAASAETSTEQPLEPQTPLRLPRSYQWRASIERNIGGQGVVSIGYVGSTGKNLLGNEASVQPDTAILRKFVTLTRNSSTYHALQLRWAGSVGRNLYGSMGYAWSHSIDDGSFDSSVFLVHPGYQLREARGSSSFDVRHTLTAALSYQVPRSRKLPDAVRNWTMSGIFHARGGFPIDVMNDEPILGREFVNVGRPDRIPGVPVWISDQSAPGGRRLNPAAFRPPETLTGTLGRNSIRGNGLAQVDASVRRDFPIKDGISVEIGVNFFNILNHPAFADPVRFLSNPFFGQSISMQSLMLGSGTPNTGLPPFFQNGDSRSAEFSVRFKF